MKNIFATAFLVLFPVAGCLASPLPNTWVGTGPFATGAGNRVITALAVSPDGHTVFSGSGSGTIFSYDYGYLLSVAISGSGSGRVSSDSGGILCSSAGENSCSATYLHGTVVSLTPITLSDMSTFDGWSAPCSKFGVCAMAMTGDSSVSAGFGLGNEGSGPRARVGSVSGTGYASVFDAYQAAGTNTVILSVLGVHPPLGGLLNEIKTVTLKGGYASTGGTFTTQTDYSSITGPVKVKAGRLNADKVRISPP